MTLYLDTSALIKLYLREDGSDAVNELVANADVLITSAIAYAESRATFARCRRERRMTFADHAAVVAQFDQDWRRFAIIPVSVDLAMSAGQLAAKHGIRGCDAIHLAAFERVLATTDDDDVRFSCADERLTKAARRLG